MGNFSSSAKASDEYECKTTMGTKKGGMNFKSVEKVDKYTADVMDNNYSKSSVSPRSDQYWDCGKKGTTVYRTDWKR